MQDDRFNDSMDKVTGYTTHSIACLPFFNHQVEVICLYSSPWQLLFQGEVAGVAQIVNKKSGPEFTKADIEVSRLDFIHLPSISLPDIWEVSCLLWGGDTECSTFWGLSLGVQEEPATAESGKITLPRTVLLGPLDHHHHQGGQGHAQVREMHHLPPGPEDVWPGWSNYFPFQGIFLLIK